MADGVEAVLRVESPAQGPREAVRASARSLVAQAGGIHLTAVMETSTPAPSPRAQWMARVKRFLGPRWTVKIRCLTRGLGLPRWGNLRRLQPFSENFGFDRGTAVDRYYLEKFLERHRKLISGRVLEIQSLGYTSRYGQNVVESHTVDVLPDFNSTYVCDLAKSEGVIPSEYYDCFLLPNTLSVLQDIARVSPKRCAWSSPEEPFLRAPRGSSR